MSIRFSRFLGRAVSIFAAALVLASTASALISEQVIFNFTVATGGNPESSLLQDSAGRLYGTTYDGGDVNCGFSSGCGVVFELAPKAGGTWNYRQLYVFKNPTDGLSPRGNLLFDPAGSLYGITEAGGGAPLYPGTVYKLTPAGSGAWTKSTIHVFGSSGDGTDPRDGLTMDAAGNLYGTTYRGGAYGAGTVYELMTNSDGSWTEKVLYSFGAQKRDGASPWAGVTLDTTGNLFGTTELGGTANLGTVFELSPDASGGWVESTIYSLKNLGWQYPISPVLLDSAGHLYVTTTGGPYSTGNIFELAQRSDGSWGAKLLYAFGGYPTDGGDPQGPLVFDKAGNLYGATYAGGSSGTNHGTVYKLIPHSNGTWSETVIYSFTDTDGMEPAGGVTFGKRGVLYGTTQYGGSANLGTVFEITP